MRSVAGEDGKGHGGQGWIRTSVRKTGQIYSLLPLTTRPPVRPVRPIWEARSLGERGTACQRGPSGAQRPAIASAKPCHALVPITAIITTCEASIASPPQIQTGWTRPRVRQS